MRFGCCLNMVSCNPDGTGMELLDTMEALGYDYAELPLAESMMLSAEVLCELKAKLSSMSIGCESFNNFFPKHIRLTGNDVDFPMVCDYTERSVQFAAELGAKNIVFGSAGAKNIPDGFPIEQAYEQIVRLLNFADTIVRRFDITISIEPLRKAECNLINTFEEGCRLAKDVGGSNIKVLVDLYHLFTEQEPTEHIIQFGKKYLSHIHISNPFGRVFPKEVEEAEQIYIPFALAIQTVNYDGRISCEAYSQKFVDDASKALCFLKKLFN